MLVTIKPANVDALIIERSTMNKDNKGFVWRVPVMRRFKLQFNTLEISAIFYDKLRTVSERDFLDIVNKRVEASSSFHMQWNMSEKGKIKQSILPVYLVYIHCSFQGDPSSHILPRRLPRCRRRRLLFLQCMGVMNRRPSMNPKMAIPSPFPSPQLFTHRRRRTTRCRTS